MCSEWFVYTSIGRCYSECVQLTHGDDPKIHGRMDLGAPHFQTHPTHKVIVFIIYTYR